MGGRANIRVAQQVPSGSKDYEALSDTTEAWINIAMIHLMLMTISAFMKTLWKHPLREYVLFSENGLWVSARLQDEVSAVLALCLRR